MTRLYDELSAALAAHGLLLRGGFHATAADGVPAFDATRPARTVLMIGHAGAGMWQAFSAARAAGPNPLDRWSQGVIDDLAQRFGARPVYPYDTPSLPFLRWAERAWPLFASPLGLLIDTEYGLWHALRGALLLPDAIDLPEQPARASPCATCVEKPCLTACPVSAFSAAGYDVPACRGHLRTAAGEACLDGGCGARGACPVGVGWRYPDAQIRFHMESFSGIKRPRSSP